MSNSTPLPVDLRILAVMAFCGGLIGLTGCDGGGSSVDPPSPPTNVEATAEDGIVNLTWDGGADVSGYNVYRGTSSLSGVSGTPVSGDDPLEQSGLTDESVENGTRYYYRVTAVGEGGESEPSPEVSIRPFPSPPSRP